MVEVRRVLEAEVATLAAQRRNAQDIRALKQAIKALNTTVKSGSEVP